MVVLLITSHKSVFLVRCQQTKIYTTYLPDVDEHCLVLQRALFSVGSHFTPKPPKARSNSSPSLDGAMVGSIVAASPSGLWLSRMSGRFWPIRSLILPLFATRDSIWICLLSRTSLDWCAQIVGVALRAEINLSNTTVRTGR